MKKGLLSILALAVTIVGCQNYDDQFDALNTQITALKSQVEGLSAVQSAVTALQGQLASLSSAALTSSDLDAALSAGLADIVADVEALQSSLADVASGADVQAINDAVTDAQADLDELLANSSVFSGDVIVNSPSTLDVFLAMGSTLNIVNGKVDIDVTSEMSMEDVQALVNNILTTTEDFSYTAGTGVDTEVTFNNLTGTQTLTIDQEGGYVLQNLTSATVIELDDDSSVDVVDLRSLTSVTSLSDGTAAGTFTFSKATELHLTALPRYNSTSLSLGVDEGGTLAIPVLASVDADGDEARLNLTVEGASSLDFSLITMGNISATDVESVTGGSDHDGTISLEGVTTAVIPNFTRGLTITGTSDLESIHVVGATPNVPTGSTAVTTTPGLDLTNQTGLESAIIEGTLGAVVLSGNTKLTDVTYSANSESLEVTGASDLTSLAIAGTTKSISVTSNSDLESLVITAELNTAKGNASAAPTSGSLVITGNTDLTSITSAFDPIKTLTITGNTDLETLDFTGTALVGGATDKATVTIGSSSAKSNNLIAALITDSYAETETGIGAGSISDESGISTLKTYLDAAIAAKSDTGVKVYLDEITKYVIEQAPGTDATEYDDIIHGHAQAAKLAIVNVVPADVTAGDDAVAGKRAWLIDLSSSTATVISHTSDGSVDTEIFNADLNTNPSLAIDQIEDADVQAAATAVGITLSAYQGGNPAGSITITADGSTGTTELAVGVASTTYVAQDDMISVTVGGQTATGTLGSLTTNNATITGDIGYLAAAIEEIWEDRWNGTASKTATIWNVSQDGTSTNVVNVAAKAGSGSRGHNAAISVSVSQGTDTSTVPFIGYYIGDTVATSDNKAIGDDLIITALANTAGTILGQHDNTDILGAATTLTSTLYTVVEAATATTNNIYPTEARADVVNAEAGTSDVVNSTASTTDYTAWIGV